MSKLPIVGLIYKNEYYYDELYDKVEDGTMYKLYGKRTDRYHVTSLLLNTPLCSTCHKIICGDIFYDLFYLYCNKCKPHSATKLVCKGYPFIRGEGLIDFIKVIDYLHIDSFNIILNNKEPLKALELIFENKFEGYKKGKWKKRYIVKSQLYCKDNQLMMTKLRTRLLDVFGNKILRDRVTLLLILKEKKIKIPKQVLINCILPHLKLLSL